MLQIPNSHFESFELMFVLALLYGYFTRIDNHRHNCCCGGAEEFLYYIGIFMVSNLGLF